MGELLKKIWESKAGKVALLGGGGVAAAAAVWTEVVPENAKEVDMAGYGLIALLALAAPAALAKLAPKIAGLFGGKKDGAAS